MAAARSGSESTSVPSRSKITAANRERSEGCKTPRILRASRRLFVLSAVARRVRGGSGASGQGAKGSAAGAVNTVPSSLTCTASAAPLS